MPSGICWWWDDVVVAISVLKIFLSSLTHPFGVFDLKRVEYINPGKHVHDLQWKHKYTLRGSAPNFDWAGGFVARWTRDPPGPGSLTQSVPKLSLKVPTVLSQERIQEQAHNRADERPRWESLLKQKVYSRDTRAGKLERELCDLGVGFLPFIDSC